jgi:predicted amidohydrolase
MEIERYSAATIQTDLPNPSVRSDMGKNTRRVIELIDYAVTGYKPFLPVKLLVFPEFCHAAPAYETLKELRSKLAVEIPNEHTARIADKAKELEVYIQMGSMLEVDPKYPRAVFNTACLVGPEGILYKYRKVYPWLPWEVHTSPHDIADYEEEIFPVASTEVGRIGTAICYDWLFPEVLRELSLKGAEILLRVSAYMDPFGAHEPNDWWTVVNRCRALENIAYVVAANQGASLENYPPFSWPGGSMIVDYDGRVVVQATPGNGEKITVGPIDVGMVRYQRQQRQAHQMLVHLRTGAHAIYRKEIFKGGDFSSEENRTYDDNAERIAKVRKDLNRTRQSD